MSKKHTRFEWQESAGISRHSLVRTVSRIQTPTRSPSTSSQSRPSTNPTRTIHPPTLLQPFICRTALLATPTARHTHPIPPLRAPRGELSRQRLQPCALLSLPPPLLRFLRVQRREVRCTRGHDRHRRAWPFSARGRHRCARKTATHVYAQARVIAVREESRPRAERR